MLSNKGRVYRLPIKIMKVKSAELSFNHMARTHTPIKHAECPVIARDPFSAAYRFNASMSSFFPAGTVVRTP